MIPSKPAGVFLQCLAAVGLVWSVFQLLHVTTSNVLVYVVLIGAVGLMVLGGLPARSTPPQR